MTLQNETYLFWQVVGKGDIYLSDGQCLTVL